MIPTLMADSESPLSAPGHRVGQGHVGAGDGGGAGATVGLQDVAVQGDGVLTQGRDVDDAAQGTADKTGDLVGTAANLASHGLSARALGAGARQHGVLGGHPALAAALAPAGDALSEGCDAQDASAAELDQDAALAVLLPAAGDGDRAQLIGGAPVLAGEGGCRSHACSLPVGRRRAAG